MGYNRECHAAYNREYHVGYNRECHAAYNREYIMRLTIGSVIQLTDLVNRILVMLGHIQQN